MAPYYGDTSSSPTYCSNDTSYHQNYVFIYKAPEPLPLKLIMKIWASERALLIQEVVKRKKEYPFKFDYERPVPLRGVRLNGHGWAA